MLTFDLEWELADLELHPEWPGRTLHGGLGVGS